MEFEFTEEQHSFRLEARSFFRNEVTEDLLADLEAKNEEHDPAFHRKLAQRGWIGLQWPRENGGLGLTDIESAILMEEAGYVFAPMTGYLVAVIAGSTILHQGNDVQIDRYIPEIVRGETLFALGYTEPEAGSDLASLQTRALPTEGGWRLTGSKMFTSLAHEANYALIAARTNPDAPKHRGVTIFIVPLDRRGISIAAVPTLGGFRTNILYLDEVPVGESDVLGSVDKGWQTLGAALDLERTGASRLGFCRRLLDHVWGELGDEIDRNLHVSTRLAELEMRLTGSRLLSYRAAWMVGRGQLPTAEAAMAKVVSTELAQEIAGTTISLLGDGALVTRSGEGPLGGLLELAYRNAARFTVTAGTSEIQRAIIATKMLGLPKGA